MRLTIAAAAITAVLASVLPAAWAPRTMAAVACPIAIVHKGLHWPYSAAPENSLAAIDDAMRAGARWVETDVAMSRDGQPVIMHGGATFGQVTGRTGTPADYTFAQLTAMRLRTHPGAAFTAQRIPSMAAYLARVRALHIHVEIEVAGTGAQFGTYIRVLKAYGAAGFAQVSGTSPANLAAVRRAYPGMRTDLLVAPFWPLTSAGAAGSVMVDAATGYLTAAQVAALARQHVLTDIWTPVTPAQMRQALAVHPHAITTDNLVLFRQVTGC